MAGIANNIANSEVFDYTRLSEEELVCKLHQLKSELTNVEESLTILYGCKSKYAASKEALEAFQPNWDNRQILVPLTSSMYVPGRIQDMQNLMINIGTGYYIEKDLDGAKDYFKRRVEHVEEQIIKLEKLKLNLLNGLNVTLEMHASVRKMKQQQPQSVV